MPNSNWGATREDWFNFSVVLGLETDLLPVVSNLEAKISPVSKMKALGKTPSVYNSQGMAVGVTKWTEHQTTEEDIERWYANPDYGICLIGRRVKAIDVDITDQALADKVAKHIADYFGRHGATLPVRYRSNSSKVLFAFACSEVTEKRIIRCGEHGLIEFLGNNQQFIVAGTHSSGVRYEWDRLEDIPDVPMTLFDSLWSELQAKFGVEPEQRERPKKKAALSYDEPVFKSLEYKGMILSTNVDGSVNIECPYAHEHTTDSAESATVYWPAHTGGFAHASIKCLHAHCAHRSTEDFKEGLGFSVLDDFEDISNQEVALPIAKPREGRPRFVEAFEFAKDWGKQSWLVKNLIPESGIGSVFGPSGSGKTFITLDIVASIARGLPWKDLKTKQGRAAYICAEGSFGFRKRIAAYVGENKIQGPGELPISVLNGRPNLMDKKEINELILDLKSIGEPIRCVIIDTYAACMVGDENSGVDAGKVIANCKRIEEALGCVVILIHHSGKDATRGARGWSGMRAAVDFEFQVVREGDRHALVVSKQKDGDDSLSFGFELVEVCIGIDDDLDPVNSCVIRHTDILPLTDKTTSNGGKVGPKESALYGALQDLYGVEDEWPTVEDLITYTKDTTGYRESDLRKSLAKLVERGKVVETPQGFVELASE